jgi:hypothetical protein
MPSVVTSFGIARKDAAALPRAKGAVSRQRLSSSLRSLFLLHDVV